MGVLQLSLDLTAAFDNILWADVQKALHHAGVNIATQEISAHLALAGALPLPTQAYARTCSPQMGTSARLHRLADLVGCGLLLFFVLQLIITYSQAGFKKHLTLYADDSHLRWRFATSADFDKTMNELRQVFACFKKFHLRINLEKTKAILKIVGNMKHRIYKQHVRKHPNGRRLLLMSGDPSQWLSLVTQAEYLGLIISYDQFEQQSLRHRIGKAHGRRWALASILHSHEGQHLI